MKHKLTKENIILFFKFNKFSFIELFWTTLSIVCDSMFFKQIGEFNAPIFLLVICGIWVSASIFGLYRIWMSFKTTKQRFDDYYKCIEIFNAYGVKKSLIYSLRELPCTSTVSEELIKKYNIKDIKMYEN